MNHVLAFDEVLGYPMVMSLTDDIRKAIESCGMTRYRISQETGIPQSVLSRFMAGHGAASETLDKLADLLNLKIQQRSPRRSGKRR